MLKEFQAIYQKKSLTKILFVNFFFFILLPYSNVLAKELVIALVLDSNVIKTDIIPETKKQSVISKMSIPTHLTIMWLKDLPNTNNPKVNAKVYELQQRLENKAREFLSNYEYEKGRAFKVVIEKVEKDAGGHILGGIYLLPTEPGHIVLTNLIKALKQEVQDWKIENPTIPINFYKYFSQNQFLPHITVLETLKANSIFSSGKNNYGQEIDETIQNNKPEGFNGIPVPILHTSSWFQ